MKNFARSLIAAQTMRPDLLLGVRLRLAADVSPMFDSATPEFAGSLAGEALAATLENQPEYPKLCLRRHRALFARLDSATTAHFDRLAKLLPGLGFDEAGIVAYRDAAMAAFRVARPPCVRRCL